MQLVEQLYDLLDLFAYVGYFLTCVWKNNMDVWMKNTISIWIATISLDTSQPLNMASFILYWWQQFIGTMFAFAVIKHFDVIEYVSTGIISGWVDFLFDSLSLQQLEEAFRHGVIMIVTASAHTSLQTIHFQESLPVMAGILASLIWVHRHLLLWISTPYSHQQSVENNVFRYSLLHWPADYLSGEQVDNNRQIQPAFVSSDMRDIRYPGFIRRSGI